MTGTRRTIEVFTAGCPICEEAVSAVQRHACPSCEISILDTRNAAAATRARRLGVRSLPAVAVDGKLAGCCARRGPDEAMLRAAGLGRPVP